MRRALIGMAVGLAICTSGAAQVAPPQLAQLREARQQLEAGDPQAATESLEALIDQRPDLADAHRLLGHAYRQLGEGDRARDAFVRSIARGRVAVDTLIALTQLDREAGRDVAAATSLQWLTWLEPDDPRYPLLLAQRLLDAGMVEAARGVAEAAARRRPDSADVLRLLGNIHLQAGDTREALTALATAYRLGPDAPGHAPLARTVAELHHQQGTIEPAITWYRRAVNDHTNPPPGWRLRLAELLIAGERHREARDALRDLREVDGVDLAAVHRWLGHAERKIGNDEAATDAFRHAIDAGLRDPDVLHFVVHRALEAGDSDTLRKYLPLLEGEAPVSLAITQTLLRARLELNEPDKARRTVRRYVERAGLDQNARRFIDRIASFEN